MSPTLSTDDQQTNEVEAANENETEDLEVELRKKAPRVFELVSKHADADQEYENEAVDASILFADLVGSVEYKQNHRPIKGMVKTLRHNQ